MVKYGTFVMFQNTETDEIVEVALADQEGIKKYAEDSRWREVGYPTDDNTDSDPKDKKEKEF